MAQVFHYDIYRTEHLLTYENLKTLKTSILPNEKAKVVSKSLSHYCFMLNDTLYTLNKYVVYEKFESKTIRDAKLRTMITQLLDASFSVLADQAKDALTGGEDGKKAFVSMMNKKGINTYIDELITYLTKQTIKLDGETKWQMHFLNGYIDLKDKTFKERELGKHYISRCISRDYVPST